MVKTQEYPKPSLVVIRKRKSQFKGRDQAVDLLDEKLTNKCVGSVTFSFFKGGIVSIGLKETITPGEKKNDQN